MRADLDIIKNWVPKNSRVLDVGCGDGELLEYLSSEKAVQGYGIENDHENISKCLLRGVNVIEKDIGEGLSGIKSQSFDTVVMTQAIQAMYRPDETVEELLRVGKECIVTFPNFGHWRARGYLGFRGKMPVSKFLPYTWYDTPNIHFCTFKDFERLCVERNIHIVERTVVDHAHRDHWWVHAWPNLLGEIAIYRITR